MQSDRPEWVSGGPPVPLFGTAGPRLVPPAGQKHHIRAKAIELGVPVAEGEVVTLPFAEGRRRRDYDALRAAVERHLRRTGHALVRGVERAAGPSAFVVGGRGEDVDGLIRRLSQRDGSRIYLVEVLVTAAVSPSVQLHVGAGAGPIVCLGVSDQRWERPCVHGGSVYPSSARSVEAVLGWAGRIAAWLQDEGYAGPLGVDFQEHADPVTGHARAVLTDVHPRAEGATYPLVILRRLNAAQRKAGRPESAAFVSGTLEPSPGGLARFRRDAERFRYAAATGRGVVPYRPREKTAEGRCGVVMLGESRDEVLRAYGELQTWCRQAEPRG